MRGAQVKHARPPARRRDRKSPRAGVCTGCGCTDRWACDEGCSWADAAHTICSSCAQRGRAVAAPARELAELFLAEMNPVCGCPWCRSEIPAGAKRLEDLVHTPGCELARRGNAFEAGRFRLERDGSAA